MPFVERELQFSFQLMGTEDYASQEVTPRSFAPGSNLDILTVKNLRATARISNAVISSATQKFAAEGTAYGLTLSQMNALTVRMLRFDNQISQVLVKIKAGDRGSALTKVFEGSITSAQMDGSSAPNVPFRFLAVCKGDEAIKPTGAVSHAGEVDVVKLLQEIAPKLGCSFENNGVSGIMITDPYYSRSPYDQAWQAVEDAGIEWNNCEGNVLSIWPRGGYRKGAIAVISPRTGLVGYPIITPQGIRFKCLFNPSMRIGGKVTVTGSQVERANGQWYMSKVDHDLAAYMPQGPWFTEVSGMSANAWAESNRGGWTGIPTPPNMAT